MNATIITALLRHVLTALGGGLVVKYGVDGASVEAIAGGVATAAGVGWSIYEKRKATR